MSPDCSQVYQCFPRHRRVAHDLLLRHHLPTGRTRTTWELEDQPTASRMVFTVLGAVAELERNLIVERVKAGLRNAKAKGKRLGRPKRVVDVRRVAGLRAQGVGWKKISREMGIGVGTLYRLAGEGSKIQERVI